MSTSVVTLDFSKAQPIQQGTSLDFSKAKMLPEALKKKYGLPDEADLTSGFLSDKNAGLKMDPVKFSQAYAEMNPPPPEAKGYLANLWGEAKNIAGGLFSGGTGTADMPPIPGKGLVETGKARIEQAKTDLPGALGATTTDVAAAALQFFAKEIVGAPEGMKAALSKLSYTSEGKLTPLAESVLHPTTLPENAFRKMVPEPATYPGAQLPSIDEFYMNKAKDLMQREAQQRVLDNRSRVEAAREAKAAPQPSPFGNATSTSSPIGDLKLPEPGALPQGSSTPFVSKFTEAPSSKIVSPLSPPPPINRTLVSYDRNLLVHMARGGDLNALRELIRNPGGIDVASAVPNSKYLMEGGAPTNIYGGPK